MRKICLTVLLSVVLMCAVAITASAAEEFEINTVATSVTAGGTMTIEVTVDNITVSGGLESVDFILSYSDNVTYSSISSTLPEGWEMWTPVSDTDARTIKIAAVDEGSAPNPAVNDADIKFTLTFNMPDVFEETDSVDISFDKVGGSAAGTYAYVTGMGNIFSYMKYPVSIKVTDLPRKTTYIAGQNFTSYGMTVAVVYNDDTSEAITDYTVHTPDMTQDGIIQVPVTWRTFSTSFNITVNLGTLNSITVTPPTKTTYTVGDILDTAGMAVTANYQNKITRNVTADATVDTTTLTTAGTVTVTVTYEGKTATFDVTVNAVELTGITVTAPAKTTYFVGDTLETAGMVVTANYNNNTTDDVTEDATVDVTTLTTAGTVTVTVTYEGKTATFTVTVEEKPTVEPDDIAEGTAGELTWVIDGYGTLTISGEGAIPDYTTTSKAPWFEYREHIENVVVEDGVTALGSYAFNSLQNVESFEISETVKVVKEYAFRATQTEEITLPGVEVLEHLALTGAAFRKVTVSECLKDAQGEVFSSENAITVVAPENSYMNKFAEFYNTKYDVTTVTFEADGTVAEQPVLFFENGGDNCFYTMYQISDTENVLEISGRGATKDSLYVYGEKFVQNDDGTSFSPTYYWRKANGGANFQELREVLTIRVKNGITELGDFSLHSCIKAKNVELGTGLTRIGWRAFNACERITTLVIPEGVTVIENMAFNNCNRLTTVTIPDSVTEFGKNIFNVCRLTFAEGEEYQITATFKTTNQAFIEYMEATYPDAIYNIVNE